MPILMLTARTAVDDRVHGLEVGADDYITKPFYLEELLARIKAMLRRCEWYRETPPVSDLYRFGENEVSFTDFKCRAAGREFVLTQREAVLLKYLVTNPNRIISRQNYSRMSGIRAANSNAHRRYLHRPPAEIFRGQPEATSLYQEYPQCRVYVQWFRIELLIVNGEFYHGFIFL
jgi:DNA-binding response OmpR family regulator